ncbi:TetR/AcrR family transcriptional regulator [Actinoplanes palleronii]|uniref:TetR family transcriptional regulator n=1 Tax=Actinoplanes palleronii TaxID=113570 RepID=A0ABQ4BPF0_9ACTN|nr:TetR/AcrR family transcriptional regulator [Actinoplanes palleronii]GIE72555.1 TetR family transcriptional regulator [Actinoplanes palleronii]
MTANRLDRRKARTRAALIAAGRELLTGRDPAEVSIQEITDAADVGFGSFYNHFTSKQALFERAFAEVVREHTALLRMSTSGLTDPAEVLAVVVRKTALLPVTHPDLARIIDRAGLRYVAPPAGIGPLARRFLRHAKDVGRLCYDDVDVALACAGGAALGVLRLGLAEPDPVAADRAGQAAAVALLRMFTLVEGDARRVAARPLAIGDTPEATAR